ncbi:MULTISPECIES: hypothetical protein [unclassified Streptomyces]|uniref:hypothetical protein n=1 Tax=unclassified Streptomyces TaxID=2593676 RepID=UPI002ED5E507|nr:hypothetical protein OH827_17950 [Streptomyces sp. NBC_00891]WSY06767.1 hypothetical protein OG464_17950 [Streptomyces sp. NBC_00890]WSZ08392.1 hypothetical protein OG704_17950 [Streptomyces sp. NBC_00869]WSZ24110.1 hypothetical protein OG498_15615 [Streptomyces sp. NBC_00870]
MSLGDEDGYGSDAGRTSDAYSTIGGTRQTRTRLPDGPAGDAYGPRRPVRNSRSLITFVGVVVLLLGAIAFANMGGDDGSGGKSGSGTNDKTGAAPTAATGTKPVTGKTGIIPSGFAHDQQGAESAAANYSVALGSAGMFDRDQRRAIADVVYAPAVAAARQDALDKVYSDAEFLANIGLTPEGTAPAGQTFISRSNPVGTKVVKFGGDTASVAVWYSALFGLAGDGSKNPVSESWFTNTFELKWTGGDWKVTDFTQKDGPAPVGRDQAASSAEEMSDAVEQFGGFTYAR